MRDLTAQLNRTLNRELHTWTPGHDHEIDPWRGIRAQAQQPPTVDRNYATLLDLDVNPPIRTWHAINMVSGEYMISAATFDGDLHNPNDSDGASQLG